MATNFCPNCGAKIREGAKFCGSCGQEISDASTPKVELQKSAAPTSTQPTYTPPVNQPSPQPTYTPSQISAEGIVLKSSAPISDKRLSWATTGYYSCVAAMIIGFMLIASAGALGAIIFFGGLIGIGVVGIMDSNSIENQLDELRVTKFKFVHNVTADEVFNRLQPALNAVWSGQVTFDRRDEIISVTHDKTIYDIGLNDDGTFIVHWHKSLKNAFFSLDSDIKLCRKARTDTAVIAYELQRQFNVTE